MKVGQRPPPTILQLLPTTSASSAASASSSPSELAAVPPTFADQTLPIDGPDEDRCRLFTVSSAPTMKTMGTPATKTPTMGIERVFEKTVGAATLVALKSSFSTKPVVLIAGDQLTGKSTAAKSVAASLGGEASGTGRLVRAAAEQAGKPVEEFVKTVKPEFDVELDWQATKKIAKGGVAVFESRLAGHLGQMLENMGRKNVVSVYLVASPRERALRYLGRELSMEVRARIEAKLVLPSDATLEQCLQAIVALDDPATNGIAQSWQDIAHRDDVDKARLLELYGVDYQDRSAFDVVVITDGKQPAEVQAEILAAVQARTT